MLLRLSILYVRFPSYPHSLSLRLWGTFNSLCEIHMVFLKSRFLSVITFNSLCEILAALLAREPLKPASLSILYVRFQYATAFAVVRSRVFQFSM